MTDTPDPLESSFQAAFADVMQPRPDDPARLHDMVARAATVAPTAAPTSVSTTTLGLGLGAVVGAAVVAILLLAPGDPAIAPPPSERPPALIETSAPQPEAAAGIAEPALAPVPAVPDPRPAVLPVRAPEDERGAQALDRGTPVRRSARPAPDETDDAGHARGPEAPVAASAADLLARANEARRAGDFDAADRGYSDLQARYPKSREALLALVTHGRLLLDELDRPADALAQFTAYLDARPRGTLAEEAMVGRARALERSGDHAESEAAWDDLQARFPDSVHARPAP